MDDVQSDTHSEADVALAKSKSIMSTKSASSRSCRLLLFQPHHVYEASRSRWFDTRVLLVFRVAVVAFLLCHLVLFSLRGDFNFREYTIWNVIGLVVALFLTLMCSLLDLLRDESEYDQAPEPDQGQGEGMITDVERQPVGGAALPDPVLLRSLTRLAVPIYQTFITASIFGAVIFWAAIYDSSVTPFSYALIVHAVAAPALAAIDFFGSLNMRFRLIYVLVYTIYNALYGVALWAFGQFGDTQVYSFFDSSTQSTGQLIAKIGGVATASVFCGILFYGISSLAGFSWSCVSWGRSSTDGASEKERALKDSEVAPTTSSDETSDVSQDRMSKGREFASESAADEATSPRMEDEREEEMAVVVGSEDELDLGDLGCEKADRLSLPISQGPMRNSESGKWFRVSSASRLAASLSGGSIGEDGRRFSGGANSDTSRPSEWDSMEPPSAMLEDEFFAMPAVYSQRGIEREVVKLQPLPRSESGRSIGGILRSDSGRRIARDHSGRSIGRSGSGKWITKSTSGRSIDGSGSGSLNGQRSWRDSWERR